MTFFAIAAIVFALTMILIYVLVMRNRRSLAGWAGEKLVSRKLKKELDPAAYSVLPNVMLPTSGSSITQIDHVVVSQWGIFVIEAKVWTGCYIYGTKDEPRWTAIYSFKHKYTFQNPIRQNYRHIATLSECLGLPEEYFHSVVVFGGGATFKKDMPPGVVYIRQLPDYIRKLSQTPVLRTEQVPEIVDTILAWQTTLTPEQKAAHVENLHRRHGTHPTPTPAEDTTPQPAPEATPPPPATATPTAPLCPKCGVPMVLRTPKAGGAPFWGCPNYPRCHAILKMDAKTAEDNLPHPAPEAAPPPLATATPTAPLCPNCGVPMVLRTPKAGGIPFWGCPNYPRCHAMIDLDGQ